MLNVVIDNFILMCFQLLNATRINAAAIEDNGSEMTGKGNDSIVQKQNCVVEEIKEVELRSRHGKFVYNRTYLVLSLDTVVHLADYR